MRKGALLLSCLLAAACHTEVQPIVIDLSGKTPTPSAAPVQTPAAAPAEPRTAPPAATEVPPAPSPAVTPASASRPAAVTPEQVVDGQLSASNQRDPDLVLSFYASDARVYEFPAQHTRSGREQIRDFYTSRFQESPQLRTTVTGRMVQGDYVVDREEVAGVAGAPVRVVAVYEVRNGKIANLWLMR